MGQKVIWFSEKSDDPTKLVEALDAIEDYATKHHMGFNQAINVAIRTFLNLKEIDPYAGTERKRAKKSWTPREETSDKEETKKTVSRRKEKKVE